MIMDAGDKQDITSKNNNGITVRTGTENDLEDFFELYWISSMEHQNYSENDFLKPKDHCKQYIINRQKEYLKDNNHFFFVAENNNKIIGIIEGHIGQRDEANVYVNENMGFIDEISIMPECRKNGVGKKLIDKMVNELKNRKIEHVGLGTSFNNSTAINFYKSCGFNSEGIWMTKKLKD